MEPFFPYESSVMTCCNLSSYTFCNQHLIRVSSNTKSGLVKGIVTETVTLELVNEKSGLESSLTNLLKIAELKIVDANAQH